MRYLLLLLIAQVCLAQTLPSDRKLIEFGWDEPDTAFMRAHVEQMESLSFDGCVFHLGFNDGTKRPANFGWNCWGKRVFTQQELQGAIDDLTATRFQHWTENFLRFDAVPGDLDWFDDYTPVLKNIELAARITQMTGCRGILLDTEQYGGKIWDYSKQRAVKTKSWNDYVRQVRQRGGEFMNALQKGNPEATIFMTFGYTLPYDQAEGDSQKMPKVSYGLLPAFLDGMLDVAGPKIQFVDGYEESYDYKSAAEFAIARKRFAEGVLKGFVADPGKYREHFQLGYGLWMDFDSGKKGWSDSDFSKNYFTPDAFGHSVKLALAASDRYVWIYTQEPRWWSDKGIQKLSKSYIEAVRSARQP